MDRFDRFLCSALLLGSLLAPLSASALGFSFGGRITAITPCANGAIWVTIIPAGPFQPFYIWTPGTLTTLPIPPEPPFSFGFPAVPGIPPTHPGQEIKGVADIPYVCYIPPFIFLYGQRMQTAVESPL